MLRDVELMTGIVILLGTGLMSSAQESPVPMSIKVDHAGICGYNLAGLQQAFADLGLRAE